MRRCQQRRRRHTMKVDHHVLIALAMPMNVVTCCRSPWLWASCTANGGATKRNPGKHNLRIALE